MKQFRIDEVRARDVMSSKIVVTSPEETLSDVLGKMKSRDVSEIPVCEGQKIVGMVSYETLIKRRSLPLTTKVSNLMTLPPSISEDQLITEVAEALLTSGYRALPVVDEKGRLSGIVSRHDLMATIPMIRNLRGIKVEEIMTKDPFCLNEDDPVENAKVTLRKYDVKSMPVVDSRGRLSGVVGIKDVAGLVRLSSAKSKGKRDRNPRGDGSIVNVRVRDAMQSPAVQISPGSTIVTAIDLMAKNEISTVVVTDGPSIKGVVTQYDLVELIASFREERGVFVQITGLEECDSGCYDMMYEQILKTMKRVNRLVNPKVFNIHAATHFESGSTPKYTLRGRLTTDHEMFYAKAFDWDLMRALDLLLDSLEKLVKKEKERLQDERRIVNRRPGRISD
jgi:CBS domain-containing protein/ribosome-associated translation inhibitor RaiA